MALFNKDKKKKKKKASWRRRIMITFAVIALIIWWGLQPIRGTKEYGVCRVFAEFNVKYPSTLEVKEVVTFRDEQRVHYAYVDAYGERKLEMLSCSFTKDPQTDRTIMTKAAINRVDLDQRLVENFNKTLPYVINHERLNIIMPRRWDGTLMGLQDR